MHNYFVQLKSASTQIVCFLAAFAAFGSAAAISGRGDHQRCAADAECAISVRYDRQRGDARYLGINKRSVSTLPGRGERILVARGDAKAIVEMVEELSPDLKPGCEIAVKQSAVCERRKCIVANDDFEKACGLEDLFGSSD